MLCRTSIEYLLLVDYYGNSVLY
eukprot:COSAG02_NODE_20647_length_821_cov_1.011080_1_plen_22_part_10